MPQIGGDPFRYLRRRATGFDERGGAVGALKTYADWVTQAAVLAPTTVVWTNTIQAGTFRTTAATASGDMRGSTWNNVDGVDAGTGGNAVARCMQHAFPTQAPFDENVTSGRVIVFTSVNSGTFPASFAAVNRNGYLSLESNPAAGGGRIVNNVKFWDQALGKVMQGDPSTGGPFTEYVW